jgi:hypothetical protein
MVELELQLAFKVQPKGQQQQVEQVRHRAQDLRALVVVEEEFLEGLEEQEHLEMVEQVSHQVLEQLVEQVVAEESPLQVLMEHQELVAQEETAQVLNLLILQPQVLDKM